MRIVIELSDRQRKALARISKRRGASHTKVIQEAVDCWIAQRASEFDKAFGLWKRAGVSEDGVAYQRRLRGAETNRTGFRLRRATFGGKGLGATARRLGWDRLREFAYSDRGK